MLQKEKPCMKRPGVNTFEQNEDVYIFLVLPKYHIFSFSTALQKLQKMFSRRQIRLIYPDLQIQVFTPRLLMHGLSFWSISECLSLL